MSFLHRLVSAHAATKVVTRVCAACGKKQIVTSADKNRTVACTNCGKPVPPSKD